jgi:hypothetical protein
MARSGSHVAATRPDEAGTPGQVLYFRRPGAGSPLTARPENGETEALPDLSSFEKEQEENVDYRRRAMMNVIALAVVILLVGAGVWIADTIADLQRDQDCVLQGRGNCAPIEAPGERPQ